MPPDLQFWRILGLYVMMPLFRKQGGMCIQSPVTVHLYLWYSHAYNNVYYRKYLKIIVLHDLSDHIVCFW